MRPHPLLLALLALGGCSRSCDRGESSKPGASAATPSASAPAGPAASAPSRPPARREASTDLRTAVRAIAEGRKLTRAKGYPGAVAAFERALAADPGDAQVLAELAFAAQQAKDLDRAEAANAQALVTTSDGKLKAQILYNQGRVFETKNAKEKAIEAYRRSLALRDNAEVKRRLHALAGPDEPEMEAEGVPCPAAVADVPQICACLTDASGLRNGFLTPPPDPDSDASPAPASCRLATDTPALGDSRLFVVEWTGADSADTAHLLGVRSGAQVRLVADLGHDFEPGAWGVHETFELAGGDARTVGGRAVVVVRSTHTNVKNTMGGLDHCESVEHRETVCALGSGASASRCVAVPVEVTNECSAGYLDPNDDSDDADPLREMVKEIEARAHRETSKTSWTIGADGKLTVTLAPGSSADAFEKSDLGSHDLF